MRLTPNYQSWNQACQRRSRRRMRMVEQNEPSASPDDRSQSWRSLLRRTTRHRRRNLLLLLSGIVVALALSIFLWWYYSSYETTDDAQVDGHLDPVSARIRGHVIRVNVGDNEYVQRGAVLVEIDPKDYEVAVDQARADLENAIATA